MKRMSDVFKLPVISALMDHEHAGEITQSGESHYCLGDGLFWMASSIDHIESAAHAINSVDALADALESVLGEIKDMAHGKWDKNLDGAETFEDSDELFEFEASFSEEIKALKAYRGEK